MPEVTINYLAVLAAAVASMILGGLWYSPVLFGNKWQAYMGWKPEEIESKKKGAARGYALMFIGSLVSAYVLAHFVDYVDAQTWMEGAQTGFWAALGFMAPVTLGSVLWEGKPWGLFILNAAYQLINLAVAGAILAVWM